jgi:hypothetical protein
MKIRRWYQVLGRTALAGLAALLLVAVFAVPSDAAGGAGTSTLYHGQKLKVGQCLRVTGYYNHKASFCLDTYGVLTLSHRGKICGTDGPVANHVKTPGAYVTVTTKGDVVLYQYAGGRQLWHSGTGYFPGGHLVLSNTAGDQASLAIDTGQAFFTFTSCPKGTGLG